MRREGRQEVRVGGDGEGRGEQGEVLLDDGVMEGESGGGGAGWLEEERSVEGETLCVDGVWKTRPLL